MFHEGLRARLGSNDSRPCRCLTPMLRIIVVHQMRIIMDAFSSGEMTCVAP